MIYQKSQPPINKEGGHTMMFLKYASEIKLAHYRKINLTKEKTSSAELIAS